jgi:hypothetical protein
MSKTLADRIDAFHAEVAAIVVARTAAQSEIRRLQTLSWTVENRAAQGACWKKIGELNAAEALVWDAKAEAIRAFRIAHGEIQADFEGSF